MGEKTNLIQRDPMLLTLKRRLSWGNKEDTPVTPTIASKKVTFTEDHDDRHFDDYIVTCSDLVRRLQFSNVDDVYSFLPFETRMMDEHSKALLAGQAEIFFDGQFRKASFRVYQHVIKIEAQQTIVPLYAEIEAFSDVCYVPHPTRIGSVVSLLSETPVVFYYPREKTTYKSCNSRDLFVLLQRLLYFTF